MLLSDLSGLASPSAATKKRQARPVDHLEPAVPIVAPEPVTYQRAFVQGWLEKKATWRFAWDRRYVVLDGDRLSYKLDERKPEKGAGTVASLDCQAPTLQFTVWLVEGGSWTLRAANVEQFNTWVEALLTALKCDTSGRATHGNGAPSSPSASPGRAGAGPDAPTARHLDPEQGAAPRASLSPSQPQPQQWAANGTPNASVTASMMLSPTVTPGTASWSVPQLVSKVMKKGAWTGVWKPRVIELYDGYQLEYKSTGDKAAARTRYTIATIDASFDLNRDRQLFFATTNGERFWVQFRSRAECSVWYRTVRESLRLNCSWRWLAYPATVNAEGWSQWFSSASREAYAAVESQYHAAAIAPHPTVRGTQQFPPKVLYVFGGSKEVCRPTFQAAARSCIPFTAPSNILGDLRLLELGAANNAEVVDIQPFEERQHVKMRPRGTIGATLTAIPGGRDQAARLVLLGGTTGNVHDTSGATSTELWTAVIGGELDDSHRIQVVSVSTPSSGSAKPEDTPAVPLLPPRWERTVFPIYELPYVTFHAAVALDLLADYVVVAAPPVSSAPSTAALASVASRESIGDGNVDGDATPHRSREEQEAQESDQATNQLNSRPASTGPAAPTTAAKAAEAGAAEAETSLARPVVLLSGGLDVAFRFRNEVTALVWPSPLQIARGAGSSAPQPVALGFLPEPRAFHKTVLLADGTIVLIGGRALGEKDDVGNTALTVYTVNHAAWKRVIAAQLGEEEESFAEAPGGGDSAPVTASLPWQPVEWLNSTQALEFSSEKVNSVSITARGNTVYVLGSPRNEGDARRRSEDDGSAVKLFRLVFRAAPTAAAGADASNGAAPRQVQCEVIDIVAGTAPPRTTGATLHFLRNSLYIVGASQRVDDEWHETVQYKLLPPYRVLTD